MNGKRRIIMITVLMLMVISIVGVGAYYWYQNTYFVTTEDARITGDLIKVSPQISGRLLEFNVQEGQHVKIGQILGRQEMISLPDTSLELSIIKAPISGIVLKKQGNIGEIVTPGQALAMLVNPEKLYINANIEETKLGRIKPGAKVEIGIDQYPGQALNGNVESIGQATAATFSLLPSSSGGNFTKVIQKVPVKIQIKNNGLKLIPGTNAVIKIHVK